MKRAYVDIPEGQLHYRYAGVGMPVIMIHMSGSSSDEYEAVGNLLADRYAVYAVDLMAFGGSDRPPHLYTLEEHAQTVLSFMDALGLGKACLVGNLAGANIALLAAAQRPEKVSGLMLAGYCYNKDHEKFCAAGKLRRRQPPDDQLDPDGPLWPIPRGHQRPDYVYDLRRRIRGIYAYGAV